MSKKLFAVLMVLALAVQSATAMSLVERRKRQKANAVDAGENESKAQFDW
jgi:hypothetical protein